eukprot:TRINITY_DN74644_c0_g1_i1.p1 TRINITY_DN74644_c0_g1~~TRINITY_DN74644_c0_g1_i1.p1  ORF type:complete len:312 (-),score=17.67 TRINITY_DN74644_c0_g1_i1:236-1171(-)
MALLRLLVLLSVQLLAACVRVGDEHVHLSEGGAKQALKHALNSTASSKLGWNPMIDQIFQRWHQGGPADKQRVCARLKSIVTGDRNKHILNGVLLSVSLPAGAIGLDGAENGMEAAEHVTYNLAVVPTLLGNAMGTAGAATGLQPAAAKLGADSTLTCREEKEYETTWKILDHAKCAYGLITFTGVLVAAVLIDIHGGAGAATWYTLSLGAGGGAVTVPLTAMGASTVMVAGVNLAWGIVGGALVASDTYDYYLEHQDLNKFKAEIERLCGPLDQVQGEAELEAEFTRLRWAQVVDDHGSCHEQPERYCWH